MGILKNFPRIGKAVYRFQKRFLPQTLFKSSDSYWKERYKKGGNSGAGSYNNLAEWKGEILNEFVKSNNIRSIIELGCGDGNQLKYFNFPKYIGVDISPDAIKLCKSQFGDDETKSFILDNEIVNQKAELAISLDVLYHLIEEDIYDMYLTKIFNLAEKYVILYAFNSDSNDNYGPHVKPRKFTDWIEQNRPDYKLINHIANKFPFEKGKEDTTSFADFYFFQKVD